MYVEVITNYRDETAPQANTSLRIYSAGLVPGPETPSGGRFADRRLYFADLIGQTLAKTEGDRTSISSYTCSPFEAKEALDNWLASCGTVTTVKAPSHDLGDFCAALVDFEIAASGFEIPAPAPAAQINS